MKFSDFIKTSENIHSNKGPLLRKKVKRTGLDKKLSFTSLLNSPEVRKLAGYSNKQIKKTQKTKFYEKMILDTKPTNPSVEKNVKGDYEFYTTPQLSTIMNDPEFPQESNTYIGETLLELKKSIMNIPPGEVRGVYVQTTLDDLMEEEDNKAKEQGEVLELTCKKGCASCCHKLVYVTPDEGLLLARNLVALEGGELSEQTMNTLKFQAAFEPHQQLDYWLLDEKKTKCVFLGADKSCTIYSNRPVNCRLLRVNSPAYNCSKVATMRGQNELSQNLSLMGEMLVSASYDLAQEEKRPILSLPQAILTSLQGVKEDSTRKLIEELNRGYNFGNDNTEPEQERRE